IFYLLLPFQTQISEQMNINIIILLISVVVLAGCAATAFNERRQVAANSNLGTHAGQLTRLTDGAVSARYLLAKAGSDANHVSTCGAEDLPLGGMTDEATAAEEPLNISLLGSASSSLRMRAASSIPAGSLVYTSSGGKVSTLSSSAGTYYCVGLALSSAA